MSGAWSSRLLLTVNEGNPALGLRTHRCCGFTHPRFERAAATPLLVAYLYPGVSITSFGAALIAALVLGLLNTIVRPLLVLLTLPVTVLTLGLFLFVINALMFWAAASLLAGFNVAGFAAALIGSLIYSLCGMVIDVAVERLFNRG